MFERHHEGLGESSKLPHSHGTSSSDSEESETTLFLEKAQVGDGYRFRKRGVLSPCMIVLVTALWAASLFIVYHVSSDLALRNTFERGFDTDLGPLKEAISVHKVRFKGELAYDANGTLISVGADPKYVGPPSKEIDDAWSALTRDDGVDLIGPEAETIRGKTLKKPSGHYLVAIDGPHQLHCLNMIRKATMPDHYGRNDPEQTYRNHLDHCIDYLRQSLMCNFDMTPIMVDWLPDRHRPWEHFEAEHTCRDYDKLNAWIKKRTGHNHPLPS